MLAPLESLKSWMEKVSGGDRDTCVVYTGELYAQECVFKKSVWQRFILQ